MTLVRVKDGLVNSRNNKKKRCQQGHIDVLLDLAARSVDQEPALAPCVACGKGLTLPGGLGEGDLGVVRRSTEQKKNEMHMSATQ